MVVSDFNSFAHEWAAAWSRHDLDTVLAHFSEDCSFTSPRAAALGFSATLHGKKALREYWATALSKLPTKLQFRVDRVYVDEKQRCVTILYDSTREGQTTRACEIMTFDSSWKHVVRGEALYGAIRSVL